jgi:hypothetical protein
MKDKVKIFRSSEFTTELEVEANSESQAYGLVMPIVQEKALDRILYDEAPSLCWGSKEKIWLGETE